MHTILYAADEEDVWPRQTSEPGIDEAFLPFG
jgi:hypothetical protein